MLYVAYDSNLHPRANEKHHQERLSKLEAAGKVPQ